MRLKKLSNTAQVGVEYKKKVDHMLRHTPAKSTEAPCQARVSAHIQRERKLGWRSAQVTMRGDATGRDKKTTEKIGMGSECGGAVNEDQAPFFVFEFGRQQRGSDVLNIKVSERR